jgi:hypothetical protein
VRIVLGPCPCQGCGRLVFWGFADKATVGRWLEPDGRLHVEVCHMWRHSGTSTKTGPR